MQLGEKLLSGLVIPAHPLALNCHRKLDERRQRALTRYYLAAGAGGIAVGVHTTQFHGCIPGIHEILRRQGLLEGRWCLDPHEELSPGQMEEIDRVCKSYPHLQDDAFVQEHLDEWLS
jgi:hypothetical protein